MCQNGTLLVQDAIYLCIETGFRKQVLLIKNSPSEEDAAGPTSSYSIKGTVLSVYLGNTEGSSSNDAVKLKKKRRGHLLIMHPLNVTSN